MRIIFCISMVILLLQCKGVQNISSTEISKQSEGQLYVDELAQLYTISPNNTITKFDEKGKSLFEYSDNTLGPISVFDVSNPLQVLVFYNAFQTVKIFDRTLTLSGQIDLNKLNLFEVKALASANDNRIWVFDELNQELLKIDKNGKIQGRNNDLRLRLDKNAAPYKMIEFQNKVYLFDAENGLLIFNAFGEYIGQRPFAVTGQFTYLQGKLFYTKAGELIAYDLTDGSQKMLKDISAIANGEAYYSFMDKLIYLEDGTIVLVNLKS